MTNTKSANPARTNRPSIRYAHRPAPIPFRDEFGRECLKVPLDRKGIQHATVLASDYRRVVAAGATCPWYLNSDGKGSSYVRTYVRLLNGKGTKVQVSRLIMGAGRGSAVYYNNRNKTDLRPDGLTLARGGAKRNDELLARRYAQIAAERKGGV